MRQNLIPGLLALLVPSMLAAQEDPDSLRIQRNCEVAEHALRTAMPHADLATAHQQIRMCGAERAAAAVAARLDRVRIVTDRAQLQDEWVSTRWTRDASLFSVAVNIAQDPEASVPARVFAFRALRTLLFPRERANYEDLVGGPDDRGWPVGGCFSSRKMHDMPFRGRSLPANWDRIAEGAAERVLEDRSQPIDVRTAAACVLRRRIE